MITPPAGRVVIGTNNIVELQVAAVNREAEVC
jgi:hypothetical protein